jgi:dynein light intermediate chain 1
MPEQAFLAKNYDENAKKPDRDPRGAFRNPVDLTGAAAGIVGPLGSSSFSLPNVERALSEMEVGIGTTANVTGDAARRLSGRVPGRPPASMLSSVATSPTLGRPPTSPTTIASSPSPSGGQTQHEVLQNFFQSLLTSKDRTGASAGATGARKTAVPKGNGSGSGGEE